MSTTAAGYATLTKISGLPAYVLDYFESNGQLDVSHFDEANKDQNVLTLKRTQLIADMRSLGFTLTQIAASLP